MTWLIAERENQTRMQVYVLKLAERMLLSFFAGVAGSIAHGWVNEIGTSAKDMRVASKRNISDPRMPFGITLSASSSVWLPATPRRIFDFLCDDNNRTKVFQDLNILSFFYFPYQLLYFLANCYVYAQGNFIRKSWQQVERTLELIPAKKCQG